MSAPIHRNRLSSPFMHAFRAAHAARDAKTKLDLRDQYGDRIIASRRSTMRTTINESALRREVATDLEALLNTVALESSLDLSEHDHVRHSILNFGLPDIVHRSIDESAVDEVPNEIRAALADYEPRLVASSIVVTRDQSVDSKELKIRFTVKADLLCDPANIPVEFMADVEFDSGRVVIKRL